jgi:hypothetical protein
MQKSGDLAANARRAASAAGVVRWEAIPAGPVDSASAVSAS